MSTWCVSKEYNAYRAINSVFWCLKPYLVASFKIWPLIMASTLFSVLSDTGFDLAIDQSIDRSFVCSFLFNKISLPNPTQPDSQFREEAGSGSLTQGSHQLLLCVQSGQRPDQYCPLQYCWPNKRRKTLYTAISFIELSIELKYFMPSFYRLTLHYAIDIVALYWF